MSTEKPKPEPWTRQHTLTVIAITIASFVGTGTLTGVAFAAFNAWHNAGKPMPVPLWLEGVVALALMSGFGVSLSLSVYVHRLMRRTQREEEAKRTAVTAAAEKEVSAAEKAADEKVDRATRAAEGRVGEGLARIEASQAAFFTGSGVCPERGVLTLTGNEASIEFWLRNCGVVVDGDIQGGTFSGVRIGFDHPPLDTPRLVAGAPRTFRYGDCVTLTCAAPHLVELAHLLVKRSSVDHLVLEDLKLVLAQGANDREIKMPAVPVRVVRVGVTQAPGPTAEGAD